MDSLAKVIAKEIAKVNATVDVKRGVEMRVDFTVSGTAVVKKGEDFMQVQSFSIPYDKLVTVLLSKLNGVTMESVLKEALAEDLDSKAVKAQAEAALKRIKTLGTKKTSGKITVKEDKISVSSIEVCVNC